MAKDYELATGLDQKSQAIRVATFRLLMGKDCLQIFLNLNFGTEEIMITSSLSALEDYFLPKRNLVYERFNSCIQTPEETVDGYVNRLRKLASSRQFGKLTKEMIHDRLVIGIQDTGTKVRLLQEKDLSLDKALDMSKSSEITNKQIKSLQHESNQSNEELHLVQDKSKTKKARNQDLQIQTRPLKAQRKRGNASFVFRPNGIQSPQIVQLMVSNVEFVRR